MTFEIQNILDIKASWLISKVDGDPTLRWKILIESIVSRVYASAHHIVTVGDDGIDVFSIYGQRLTPTVHVAYGIHFVSIQDNILLLLSRDAKLFIWNLDNLSSSINELPFDHLLPQQPLSTDKGVVSSPVTVEASISSTGVICILIPSSFSAYSLDPDLKTWVQVVDGSNILFSLSEYSSNLPSFSSSSSLSGLSNGNSTSVSSAGPLSSLQLKLGRAAFSNIKTLASARDPELTTYATLSYLEHQLSASLALLSYSEYSYWLFVLVKFLAAKNLMDKLMLIFDSLIPPPSSSMSTFLSSLSTNNPYSRLGASFDGKARITLAKELLYSVREFPTGNKVQAKLSERLQQFDH